MTVTFDPGSEQAEGPFEPQSAMETIEIASGVFRDVAEDMERLRRKLQAGEMGELKDAAAMARSLRNATQQMLEERNRVDKLRKEIAGSIGEGCFDLEAARDEIGRRLACLRRAGGG
ncbi:MAG: permease [Paracoccus sp. (in: a-proteobacteria)]